MLKDILLITGFLFQDHPDINELPKASQLPHSYVFRFAVSAYLLTLDWISNGGPGNVNLERLRNDFVDMNYVAYGTFFDGILTRDAKMKRMYNETCFLLENLFDTEQAHLQ